MSTQSVSCKQEGAPFSLSFLIELNSIIRSQQWRTVTVFAQLTQAHVPCTRTSLPHLYYHVLISGLGYATWDLGTIFSTTWPLCITGRICGGAICGTAWLLCITGVALQLDKRASGSPGFQRSEQHSGLGLHIEASGTVDWEVLRGAPSIPLGRPKKEMSMLPL